MTVQSRLAPSTLSKTAQDVCWQLYEIVAAIDGLSAEEARARDRLLTRIGPLALREHSLAHRRRAALRILLASTYWHNRGLVRIVYSAFLIAFPELAFALRRLSGTRVDQTSWLPELPPERRPGIRPADQRAEHPTPLANYPMLEVRGRADPVHH